MCFAICSDAPVTGIPSLHAKSGEESGDEGILQECCVLQQAAGDGSMSSHHATRQETAKNSTINC